MKLTIGIPVLNEKLHLPETLNSIFREARTTLENFEVLIIDNASTDGTSDFLSEIIKLEEWPKNIQLRVVQNRENMGFSDSIKNLIRLGVGDYLWLLGGQEVLLVDALTSVFSYLKEAPWQIVLNTTVWDEATNSEIWDNMYRRWEDKRYNSPEDYFIDLGGPSVSISANISRREPLVTRLDIPTVTHYWNWLERWIDVAVDPKRKGEIIFISKPTVRILIEEQGWVATGIDSAGKTEVQNANPLHFTSLELTEMAKNKFNSNKTIRNSIGTYRDPFNCIRAIAIAKANGLDLGSAKIWRTSKAYGFTYWYWLVGLPLLFIPSQFFRGESIEKAKRVIHFLRKVFKAPAKNL